MNSLDKLLKGFEIFNLMSTLLVKFDITPVNNEQWKERYLTNEELNEINNEELRRQVKSQKYWAIKEPRERGQRSVKYRKYEKEVTLSMNQLEHRWSKFISDLLNVWIDAHGWNEPLIWSNNLTQIYTNYLVHKSELKSINQSSCIGFDGYL